MSHTPGPWKIRDSSPSFVGTDDKLVAMVYGDDEECNVDDRMLANSRLIATAPDLLAALKLLVDSTRDEKPTGWIIAVEAISKAEPPECSICRREHGREIVHEAE